VVLASRDVKPRERRWGASLSGGLRKRGGSELIRPLGKFGRLDGAGHKLRNHEKTEKGAIPREPEGKEFRARDSGWACGLSAEGVEGEFVDWVSLTGS